MAVVSQSQLWPCGGSQLSQRMGTEDTAAGGGGAVRSGVDGDTGVSTGVHQHKSAAGKGRRAANERVLFWSVTEREGVGEGGAGQGGSKHRWEVRQGTQIATRSELFRNKTQILHVFVSGLDGIYIQCGL